MRAVGQNGTCCTSKNQAAPMAALMALQATPAINRPRTKFKPSIGNWSMRTSATTIAATPISSRANSATRSRLRSSIQPRSSCASTKPIATGSQRPVLVSMNAATVTPAGSQI